MSCNLKTKTLEEMLESVKKMFEKNKNAFYPYIDYIRFPKYKSLANNTKINFDFPLTVFVGENGTNKTSLIQALYGSPGNNSIGKYWYSTEVDNIDNNNKEQQCLIYSYFHEGARKNVEVIKTRINREGKLDYWEPSRPIKKYGMEIPNLAELEKAGNINKTRWDLLNKPVLFYDHKEYVSAYDLCFYHSKFKKSSRYDSVQDFIRARARHLANVIENKSNNYTLYRIEQVKSNKEMPQESCDIISWIMNKSYKSIRIVEHGFYNMNNRNYSPSKTVYIRCENDCEYSEAFAGSGEARIILMLNDILNAKPKSLIVMDEPEISLHPGALEKLKIFLLWSVLEKNHQVVISTHSGTLIRGLPSVAIKVFENNGDAVKVYENVPYKYAFSSIGQKFDEKTIIFVEDDLVKYIIEDFLTKSRTLQWKDSIEVRVFIGGAENIIKTAITDMAKANMEKVYFILDGDKNYYPYVDSIIKKEWLDDSVKKVDVGLIPEATYGKLQEIIKAITKVDINVGASGNSGIANQNEKIELQKTFLRYWMNHVFFLTDEKCCPENAILGKEKEFDGKKYFADYAKKNFSGDISSSEILIAERAAIKSLDRNCSIYRHLDKLDFLRR